MRQCWFGLITLLSLGHRKGPTSASVHRRAAAEVLKADNVGLQTSARTMRFFSVRSPLPQGPLRLMFWDLKSKLAWSAIFDLVCT